MSWGVNLHSAKHYCITIDFILDTTKICKTIIKSHFISSILGLKPDIYQVSYPVDWTERPIVTKIKLVNRALKIWQVVTALI